MKDRGNIQHLFSAPNYFFNEEGELVENVSDETFVHCVLTDGIYSHPYYGVVNYSLEDLQEMKRHHEEEIHKEEVSLYKGHNKWTAEGEKSFGVYDRSGMYIAKFKDKNGKDKLALMASGRYTEEGKEIEEKEAYKYLSSEISNFYTPREFDSKDEALLYSKKLEEYFEKRWMGQEIKPEDVPEHYKNVLKGVAFTNNPFYHLPLVKDMKAFAEQTEKLFSVPAIDLSNEETIDGNLFKAGKSLFIKVGEEAYEVSSLGKNIGDEVIQSQLEKARELGLNMFNSMVFDFGSISKKVEPDSKVEPKVTEEPVKEFKAPKVVNQDTKPLPKKKERNMKFFNMSLAELKEVDADSLEEGDKEVFDQAFKMKSLEDEKAKLIEKQEQERRQFTSAIKEKEEELKKRDAEIAHSKEVSFSLQVENFSKELREKGFPEAAIKNVEEIFNDLDVHSRSATFMFDNPAKEIQEERNIFSIVKSVLSGFDEKMFRTATPTGKTSENEEQAGEGIMTYSQIVAASASRKAN